MAISCEPADLAKVVRCFDCLNPNQQQLVRLYLFREIAGLSDKTPQELVELAKCMDCVPQPMRGPVELYLLCQAATAAGA